VIGGMPKAFATVRLSRSQDGEEDAIAVDVAGEELFDADDFDEESMVQIAVRLTEAFERAVEAREARLVAALRGMVDAVNRHVDGERDGITRAISAAWGALEGKGDYVPRAQLTAAIAERDEARAKVSGTWGVLLDALQASGEVTGEVRALMEAVGIKPKVTPCDVHPHSTGGNIKTIGLFPRHGQTRSEAYSEWARKGGRLCVCGRDAVDAPVRSVRVTNVRLDDGTPAEFMLISSDRTEWPED
jgi:hypothetical protein